MNREMFNLEAMNRKLGCVLKSSKSRLKKKPPQSNNCSTIGRTQISVQKKCSIENSLDIEDFLRPRSTKNKPEAKSKRKQPSATDRQSRSNSAVSERFQHLAHELEDALQNNTLMEAALAKLRFEKTQAQSEQIRLSEQIAALTQSQSTVACLSDTAGERLALAQRQHEEERRRAEQR